MDCSQYTHRPRRRAATEGHSPAAGYSWLSRDEYQATIEEDSRERLKRTSSDRQRGTRTHAHVSRNNGCPYAGRVNPAWGRGIAYTRGSRPCAEESAGDHHGDCKLHLRLRRRTHAARRPHGPSAFFPAGQSCNRLRWTGDRSHRTCPQLLHRISAVVTIDRNFARWPARIHDATPRHRKPRSSGHRRRLDSRLRPVLRQASLGQFITSATPSSQPTVETLLATSLRSSESWGTAQGIALGGAREGGAAGVDSKMAPKRERSRDRIRSRALTKDERTPARSRSQKRKQSRAGRSKCQCMRPSDNQLAYRHS